MWRFIMSPKSSRTSSRRRTCTCSAPRVAWADPSGVCGVFFKAVELPPHTRYAILTTEIVPKPDNKTGRMPTDEEIGRYQRVRPIMNEILRGKGLELVAEEKVYVTGLRGPLEDGWRAKVASFAVRVAAAGRPAAASS